MLIYQQQYYLVNRPGVPFELIHCCSYEESNIFDMENEAGDLVYHCDTPTG